MKITLLLLALIGLGLAACSDDGDNAATAPTTVSAALSNAQTQVNNIVPDSSSLTATAFMPRVAMTTEWTTTGNTYSLGGIFGASPRDFVRLMGDNTANSSLMYRLKQVIDNLCVFTIGLPSTNGIPDLSDPNTVTLTAALKAQMVSDCGVQLGDLPPDDTVVGYRVTDVSSETGSEYDRRVYFDLSGGTSYTDFFFLRINASVNRMAYMENGSNDSLALFEYDLATNTFKFEFSEVATTFTTHYRGILDANNDLGRFVAAVNNGADTSTAVVSTQEGGGDELHVSYSFDDDANTNDFANGSSCVNSNDFSIATDNTETCGDITGNLAAAFTFDFITSITTGYVTGTSEGTSIQFTSLDNMLTANQAQ
ncbi:MAG: hypothetical protein HRT44_03375 [Bdellovibrionales bacterium]|nr:hypothetical protein [Bdellovibrionales bacterium]